MSSNKSQPIGQVQLPQCQICNLQPIPQSVQHVPFIMLEIFLFFISVKLAIIFLFFSYCVSRNAWYCPQCKRQVQVNYQVQGITENLIIRMGNCMFMLSKFKFRVIAALISAYILYLLVLEVYEKPKNSIQKTWISLANNCGYEAYLENAFRANELYAKYPQLGEWNITGIFLKQEEMGMQKLRKFYIKMRPTQFKNPLAEDIVVLITSHTQVEGTDFAMADLIEFKGQWEGRQNAHLKFVATGVRKLGSRFSPTDVQLLTEAEKFIRVHEKQSRRTRQQHQRHVDDQIKAITKKQ